MLSPNIGIIESDLHQGPSTQPPQRPTQGKWVIREEPRPKEITWETDLTHMFHVKIWRKPGTPAPVFPPQRLDKDLIAEYKANLHAKQTSAPWETASVIITSGPDPL